MPNVRDLKKQFELQRRNHDANEGTKRFEKASNGPDINENSTISKPTISTPSDEDEGLSSEQLPNGKNVPSPQKVPIPQQNALFLTVPNTDNQGQGQIDSDTSNDSDLAELKKMTTRLNLSTQRPSYVEWRSKYIDTPDLVKRVSHRSLHPGEKSELKEKDNSPWTIERERDMEAAIKWLRNELLEMRNADQTLARTLVTLRHDIHRLKLELSCEAHRAVLDDVEFDLEEEEMLSELSDCPLGIGALSPLAPLKQLGVTKMNIERRRFSLC